MFKKARIPAALRNAVMAKNDCCVACGTWDAEECGHLISEVNGGPMILENLVRMCGHCNRRLHDKNVAFKSLRALCYQPCPNHKPPRLLG